MLLLAATRAWGSSYTSHYDYLCYSVSLLFKVTLTLSAVHIVCNLWREDCTFTAGTELLQGRVRLNLTQAAGG